MAGQGQQRIITGANLFLYINGRLFAKCVEFQWNDQTPTEEIRGLDILVPVELAPTTISVSGSMVLWRLKGDGGVEGAGIRPTHEQLTRGKYFSIMLIERTTDSVVFRADRCTVEGQQWAARTRALMQGNVVWKGISSSNEAPRR